MAPVTQICITPLRANSKTWAGGPSGCSNADTIMFVSRTTGIMSPAVAGLHAGAFALQQSQRRFLRLLADRGPFPSRSPKICEATRAPDPVRRAGVHILQRKDLAPAPSPLAPRSFRPED